MWGFVSDGVWIVMRCMESMGLGYVMMIYLAAWICSGVF